MTEQGGPPFSPPIEWVVSELRPKKTPSRDAPGPKSTLATQNPPDDKSGGDTIDWTKSGQVLDGVVDA